MQSPIALFVYNRPKHTQQTVEALQKNLLASDSDLYIFSDGQKSDKDLEAVQRVRNYIHSITGFKSVKVIESPANKGLANSIISGVTKVLKENDTIIVLEDDMVTSPYFLSYVNDALELYKNEEKVISINSFMYDVKGELPPTFFIRGADCGGWATWRRGWALFEPDGRKLLNALESRGLAQLFNFNNHYPLTKMLQLQTEGKIDSWAIRWQASAFLEDKLTLYPSISLYKNIGFDNTGTNSGATTAYEAPVNYNKINLEKVPVSELPAARKSLEKYFNSIKPTLKARIHHKLRSIYFNIKNRL